MVKPDDRAAKIYREIFMTWLGKSSHGEKYVSRLRKCMFMYAIQLCTFVVPRNNICSQKCANPGRSSGSDIEPTYR